MKLATKIKRQGIKDILTLTTAASKAKTSITSFIANKTVIFFTMLIRVKFYNGTTYLKTIFSSPYTYTISNLPAGSYSLTVKATDNNGAQTTSAPVNIKVTNGAIVSNKPYLKTEKTPLNDALSLRHSPNPATNIVNIYLSRLQQNKPSTLSIISVSGMVLSLPSSIIPIPNRHFFSMSQIATLPQNPASLLDYLIR